MIGRVSDIDLRLLRVFVTVVESGGFAVATARLNVAESTISQHMSDLEKRLGLRLCERGRSGFRLTKGGQEVYEATQALMTGLDGFRDRLAALSAAVPGRFAIGLPDAIATLGEGHVGAGLGRFLAASPSLHPVLSILSPRDLERQVIEGKLACAVAPEHRRVAGLDYRPLFAERNLLYCGRGHPVFERAEAGLADEEVDHLPRIARGYLEGFDAHLFTGDGYAATVTETEGAAILIQTGRFVGFLPEHFAASWVRAGQMRAVASDRYAFIAQFHLITRRDSDAALIDRLVDHLADPRHRRPAQGTPPAFPPPRCDLDIRSDAG